MYMVLNKEKPCIGSVRGLNLAAVRPMTIELTEVLEHLSNLTHKLLHKPALTENRCISCINVTKYSAVTKGTQSL
jgi:hypothetical protein